MSNEKPVRTRFAPSPTGYLHVGGARTALFNYLYARAKKGSFILRIEDTDQARSDKKSRDQMIESMIWLGLDWDEGPEKGGAFGPYSQSERLDIYKEYAQKLIDEKKAYLCFCSNEELEAKKKQREAMGLPPVYDGKCRSLEEDEIEKKRQETPNHVIRFKMSKEEIIVQDKVQGVVKFDSSLIGDFIIVKSDGFPSYNYAVVVDDNLMQINHVIRGVGHLSNTPRQIAIYRAFNWEEPVWAHVSEIVGSDHKKLSKRHGATAITSFREMGFPPESFLNYMSLLGWSPPDGVEFMTKEKIISQFDIERCNKSPSMFDVFDLSIADGVELSDLNHFELEKYLFAKSKLNWLSNNHIRSLSEERYLKDMMPFVKESGQVPEEEIDGERLKNILLSLRVYLDYLMQIEKYIGDFFNKFDITEDALSWLKKEHALKLTESFLNLVKDNSDWKEENIMPIIKEAGSICEVKGKDLFMTIRAASTGKTTGLELPVYLALLGKERVLKRLENSIDAIRP
ncbi:MAG: glutamate--tRNA ligase [Spirochaetia bacterium]|nr:glutamate--tRNA ligase [Spirochaetia bacterium]